MKCDKCNKNYKNDGYHFFDLSKENESIAICRMCVVKLFIIAYSGNDNIDYNFLINTKTK